MPNQNVINYLQQNKEKFPQEVLRQKLVEAGYPLNEIEEGIRLVYLGQVPATPKVRKSWLLGGAGFILGVAVIILLIFLGDMMHLPYDEEWDIFRELGGIYSSLNSEIIRLLYDIFSASVFLIGLAIIPVFVYLGVNWRIFLKPGLNRRIWGFIILIFIVWLALFASFAFMIDSGVQRARTIKTQRETEARRKSIEETQPLPLTQLYSDTNFGGYSIMLPEGWKFERATSSSLGSGFYDINYEEKKKSMHLYEIKDSTDKYCRIVFTIFLDAKPSDLSSGYYLKPYTNSKGVSGQRKQRHAYYEGAEDLLHTYYFPDTYQNMSIVFGLRPSSASEAEYDRGDQKGWSSGYANTCTATYQAIVDSLEITQSPQ